MRRWLAAALFITLAAQAFAEPLVLTLTISGDTVAVFSKARDACDSLDIPDAPARAIRTRSGVVQLYAPHFHNRRLIGPDLLHLSPDCAVVFQGGEVDDPAAFNDRGWITSLHTLDGQTIHAAIHNEFQGHRRPASCPSGRYMDCWYNTITAAVSVDEGRHFQRRDPALIATLPYRHDAVTGHHAGYFNPTNTVSLDGAMFMMMFTTSAKAQQPGNCLLRTHNITDPGAWRGWDGHAFGVTFINPYLHPGPPEPHVCAPVGTGRLRWPVTSLVRHAPTGWFIAVMMNAGRAGGVFYAASRDLVTWSAPVLLWPGPEDGKQIAYPSLLDAASLNRDFSSVGGTAHLFVTRFNRGESMDRDLIRLPVKILASGAGDPG